MAIIYSKSAQNCILLQRVCQRYFPAQVSSSSNQTNSHIIPNCKFQTRVRYFSISSKKQSTTPLATAKQDPKYFNYRWSHEQPGKSFLFHNRRHKFSIYQVFFTSKHYHIFLEFFRLPERTFHCFKK